MKKYVEEVCLLFFFPSFQKYKVKKYNIQWSRMLYYEKEKSWI